MYFEYIKFGVTKCGSRKLIKLANFFLSYYSERQRAYPTSMFSYLLQCKDQYFETKRVLWRRSQKKNFKSSNQEQPHLPPKSQSNKNFNASKTLSIPRHQEAMTVHKALGLSKFSGRPDIENHAPQTYENERLVNVTMRVDRNLTIFDYKVLYAIGKY